MQAFQSSLTQQVEGVAAEVAQLSAAQPLPAASGGSAGNAAAASDQMPASVEAAVSGPAQDPQERVQNPQDGKQTAYERMQVGTQRLSGPVTSCIVMFVIKLGRFAKPDHRC